MKNIGNRELDILLNDTYIKLHNSKKIENLKLIRSFKG